MNDQYYTADPSSESRPVPCAFPYRGYGLNFMTDAGVFSKGELDVGSRLLLDALPELSGDVLDLGCGWGAIGVAIAKANKDWATSDKIRDALKEAGVTVKDGKDGATYSF